MVLAECKLLVLCGKSFILLGDFYFLPTYQMPPDSRHFKFCAYVKVSAFNKTDLS